MPVALLCLGFVSVLVGVLMAYGGYANFDFSYGSTLAIIAAIAIVGGLLLVAAAAILGQLHRIRIAMDKGGAALVTAPDAGDLERGPNAFDSQDRRLPVLPPRSPRRGTQPADHVMDVAIGAAQLKPDADGSAGSKPAELPRSSRSEQISPAPAGADVAVSAAANPVEMTGVSDDILPAECEQPVTILKSGVIEGMAYTLYSDGSVEAELPQGILRFASVAEWREYLKGASH